MKMVQVWWHTAEILATREGSEMGRILVQFKTTLAKS
jgi:hypothetical protein